MGKDSQSKGCGLESLHNILDEHFFTLISQNCIDVCLKKTENELKRGRENLKWKQDFTCNVEGAIFPPFGDQARIKKEKKYK